METKIQLDKELVQAVLNFLAQCPYAQVHHLVGPLMEQANSQLAAKKEEKSELKEVK